MNEKAAAVFCLVSFAGGAIAAWRESRYGIGGDWIIGFIGGTVITGMGIVVVVLTVASIGVLLGLRG